IPREARDVGGLLAESPDAGVVRGDAGRSDAPLAVGRLPRRSGFRGFGALGPHVPRLGGAARDAGVLGPPPGPPVPRPGGPARAPGVLGPPRAPRLPRARRGAARGRRCLAREVVAERGE